MILHYQGADYEFDPQKVTVDEWRELKRKYKMTPGAFSPALSEADPDASTFVYWVMLRRAGRQDLPLGDQLKPDIIALNAAIAEAEEAEKAAAAPELEPGPDPTQPPPSPVPSPSPPAAPSPVPVAAGQEGGSLTGS